MIDVFRAVVEILCIDKDTDTLFRMFDDAHENRLECKVKNQNDDANMNNFIKTTLSQECTLVQCLEQKFTTSAEFLVSSATGMNARGKGVGENSSFPRGGEQ